MKPSAVKGTFARLWEGIFMSIIGEMNISVMGNSDGRFPPYFMWTMAALVVPIAVMFLGAGIPVLQLAGLAGVVIVILSIPVTTYLSLSNKEYRLENGGIVEEENFLGKNTDEVKLRDVEDIYISKGLAGRALGVGKVCLATENDIFQIDYVKNPESVKEDIESQTV